MGRRVQTKDWGLEERELGLLGKFMRPREGWRPSLPRSHKLHALRGAEVGKEFQESGQHERGHGIGGWEMEPTPGRTVRRTSARS